MKEHQAALKNDPKFVYSYFSIGRMHLWKKQMKQAGDAYVKALSLSSSNGMKGIAHASLVAIYGQQKLWAEANKHLKIATSLGMSIPENIAGVIKLNAPNREKSIAKGTVSIESATSKKMLPEIKILMIGIQHGKFKLVSDYFSSYVTKLEKEGLKKTKAGWLIALSSEIGLNQVLGKVADDVINKKIGDKIGKELLVAGMAYKEKKTDTAILINRSTLKKIENYAGARFLLGRFYTKNCLSKNKNCEEALKEHKFALTYNQDLIYSYLDMASIYTHKKQSKEAIRIYEKLLSMPSNDLIKKISHISLAKIYSGMTIWPKANKHLNRAIALGVIVPKELQEFTQIVQTKKWKNKNSFVEAMKMRAFKAGYNGNFKAAQAIFSSLAATEEEMLESANILTSMGNLAIIGYFRVLEQVSKDALEKKISTKAAKLLFEATKLAGAQLKDGISLTSNTILSEDLQSYPSAHFLLGRLFFINCAQKERNCEESLKEHRTALKHDPKLLYSYLDMGKVYRKMKKANETIKIYEKASSLPSSDRIKGIIHFELTKEYGQLMKGTKAQEHLQKSVSLGIVVPKVMTDIVNATVQMEKKSINGTIEGWTLAFRGKGWAPNFYFKSGILSKTGNKVLMPVLVNYKSAKKIGSTGKHYKSMKSDFEHDCGKKQYRVVNITTYSEREGKGEVLQKNKSSRKWSPIKSGKVAERLWSHACMQHQQVAKF